MNLQVESIQRCKHGAYWWRSELKTQSKDEDRWEEEVTKEPKRFTKQEVTRGFSLLEEALLVSEAEDQKAE